MNTKHLTDMTRNGGDKNGCKLYCNSCNPVQTSLLVCTKMQKRIYPLTQNTPLTLTQYAVSITGRLYCLLIQSELLLHCTSVCSGNILLFQFSFCTKLSSLWNHSKKILQILVQLDLKLTSSQKIFSDD